MQKANPIHSLNIEPATDMDDIPATDMDDIGPCILEEEVATAIKELKNNKAEGIDEIPAELLKCMGNMAVKVFAHLCQKIYETGKWTADFLQTVIIPLLRNVVISGQSACWGMQQKY